MWKICIQQNLWGHCMKMIWNKWLMSVYFVLITQLIWIMIRYSSKKDKTVRGEKVKRKHFEIRIGK